jgi:hypothetical protein
MWRRIGHGGRWRDNAFGTLGDDVTDDGVGRDERNAKFHSDGEQRQRGEGRDVGSGLRNCKWLRIFVGDDEHLGNGDQLYGASGGAESSDGNADGYIGKRWNEVGVGNDYGDVGCANNWNGRDDFAGCGGTGAESSCCAERDGGE